MHLNDFEIYSHHFALSHDFISNMLHIKHLDILFLYTIDIMRLYQERSTWDAFKMLL